VRVVNPTGLHARSCAALVRLAKKHKSALRVSKADREVDGKSLFELLLLAAHRGDELVLRAEGADAEGLLAAAAELFASGFGET
jgi:phosphocarrier protein